MAEIYPKLNKIIGNTLGTYDGENENNPNAEHGFNNDTLFEPDNSFVHNKTSSEEVLQGQNNTFIVFGRDRPADESSGYGGRGDHKCGAIDICVGRMSNLEASTLSGFVVNPNTGADAARIYLSQKTDIDKNYNLPAAISGMSEARSGIAIKADDVRIVARNSLKIVTATDNQVSSGPMCMAVNGVQLIATTNLDTFPMQPMVKGDNLIEAFKELVARFNLLNSTLQDFIVKQKQFNQDVVVHTHYDNFPAVTFASPELTKHSNITTFMTSNLEKKCINLRKSISAWEIKYITKGDKHITSDFHYLN